MAQDQFAADVYSFFGRVREPRIWVSAERKHPGILRAARLLMQRLGIEAALDTLEAPVVLQNHFLCRSALYERFVREMLAPALRAMADAADPLLQAVLLQPAGYHDPSVTPERLHSIFGRPYFCMQPFLTERLFSTWLALHPEISVRQLWNGRFVEEGNVASEPEMRDVGTAEAG
jgi:hypothetical protein